MLSPPAHPRPEPLDPPANRPTSSPYAFVPTFCPWRGCPAHTDHARFAWRRYGSYRRLAAPFLIPRFRCLVCRRTFSTQTFSPTYYLKRPELLAQVAAKVTNAACDRHVRRSVKGNPHYAAHVDVGAAGSTITRLLPRLGRHAALVLAELNAQVAIREPLVADDFETFARLQLHAVALPTVVGGESSWVHALDLAPHLRGGRRTPAQRRRERRLRAEGRLPDPAARERAWERAVAALLARVPAAETLRLDSDDAPAIARALARSPHAGRIRHRAWRNPPRGPKGSPPGPAARARDGALFEVDQLHRWFRHSLAHDRRETLAFARCVNALFARHLVFALQRGVIQPRRERHRDDGTPAMRLGLLPRPLSWPDLLERRRFLALSPPLPTTWSAAYFERLPTLGNLPSRRRLPYFPRN